MRPGRGCMRRLAWVAGVLVLLIVVLRLAGPSLLEAYARWLIVEDPLPVRADAVVTLAGGSGERLLAAMEIYRDGGAGHLLIVGPNEPFLKVYTGEDSLTQGEAKRRIAIRRGVPPEAVILSLGAQSTLEEAHDVLREASTRNWSSVIIVTDPFHTRRTRAAFRSVFRDAPVAVMVHHLPIGRSRENPEGWWRRESDLMAVFTETVKLGYYLVHHGIGP